MEIIYRTDVKNMKRATRVLNIIKYRYVMSVVKKQFSARQSV